MSRLLGQLLPMEVKNKVKQEGDMGAPPEACPLLTALALVATTMLDTA